MISVVVYGRNDSYGYNLHKRAAISLNCIAEMLTDPDDEILFVDYNTPNEFPTFPEAIADTLTGKAKQILRVIRVRPPIHERFRGRTRLLAIEPVSRNIAVRRANPANRWVLSTNTDIILVPQRRATVTELVSGLTAGLYHAPRLEIPETLWEGLDRSAPGTIIPAVKQWGRMLHLDEIVTANDPLLYDGPGDFQLIDRTSLIAMDGFDEDMILGWHVDANIALRMKIHHGRIGDLGDDVFAYHCDHTRMASVMHSHGRSENSFQRFVHDVTRADLPGQRTSWGCPEETFEEIRFTGRYFHGYIAALETAIGSPAAAPYRASFTTSNFNKSDYDPRHVLPFLLDIFSSAPPSFQLGWFGLRAETLERFAAAWPKLGFANPIVIDAGAVAAGLLTVTPGTRAAMADEILERADALVFDAGAMPVGGPRGYAARREFAASFLRAVVSERRRLKNAAAPPRRFVAVNAVNGPFERYFSSFAGASATPYSSRLRHGFVFPPESGAVDWFARLQTGAAGIRNGTAIENRLENRDWIFHGPYQSLLPGRYRLRMNFGGGHIAAPADGPIAHVEIVCGRRVVGWSQLRPGDMRNPNCDLDFDVPEALVAAFSNIFEVRMRALAAAAITLTGLTIEHLAELAPVASGDSEFLGPPEWLPFMTPGDAGQRETDGIAIKALRRGVIAFGPYWPLPVGAYEACLTIALRGAPRGPPPDIALAVEIVTQGRRFGFKTFRLGELAAGDVRVAFAVGEEDAVRDDLALELRVSSAGAADLSLTSVKLSRTGDAPRDGAVAAMEFLPVRHNTNG